MPSINEEVQGRHVPHGAAIRSTPLAMLAGKTPAARGSAPFGLLRRGLTAPLCGAFWRCRGEGRPAISARLRRAEQRAGRVAKQYLDMVGAHGSRSRTRTYDRAINSRIFRRRRCVDRKFGKHYFIIPYRLGFCYRCYRCLPFYVWTACVS